MRKPRVILIRVRFPVHGFSVKSLNAKKRYILDLCVSSLRRGHANLLCIVPILADDLRRGSKDIISPGDKPLRCKMTDPMGQKCDFCLKMLQFQPISAAARPKSAYFHIFAKTTKFFNPISTHSRVFFTFWPPPKFSKPGFWNWALKRKVQIHHTSGRKKLRTISWRSICCMRVADDRQIAKKRTFSLGCLTMKSSRWNRRLRVFLHWIHAVSNVFQRHFHVDSVSTALRFRSISQWSKASDFSLHKVMILLQNDDFARNYRKEYFFGN